MYVLAYLVFGVLLLAYGVPIALMAVCALAQLRLAGRLNPCAFALPAASGLALLLAVYMKSTASGWGELAGQVLTNWTQGAFIGAAAGWAAVYAGRFSLFSVRSCKSRKK